MVVNKFWTWENPKNVMLDTTTILGPFFFGKGPNRGLYPTQNNSKIQGFSLTLEKIMKNCKLFSTTTTTICPISKICFCNVKPQVGHSQKKGHRTTLQLNPTFWECPSPTGFIHHMA